MEDGFYACGVVTAGYECKTVSIAEEGPRSRVAADLLSKKSVLLKNFHMMDA